MLSFSLFLIVCLEKMISKSCLISLAVIVLRLFAAITIFAPSVAKRKAIALPIPRLAPVIKIVLLLNDMEKVEVMKKINRGVGLYLGPDYMLGQYYLPSDPKLGDMSEEDAKSQFVNIWRHKVLPQLIEFFHARPSVCMSILEVEKHGNGSGMKIITPTGDEEEAGASTYVFNDETEKSDDAIFEYLEKFSGLAQAAVAP